MELLYIINYSPDSGIVIPPKSVNISINELTEISCTAIKTFIDWEVNGKPVDDLNSEVFAPLLTLNQTESFRMRTLRIVGSFDSNNSNIVCFAFLQISSTTFSAAVSEPTLILVQGMCNIMSSSSLYC